MLRAGDMTPDGKPFRSQPETLRTGAAMLNMKGRLGGHISPFLRRPAALLPVNIFLDIDSVLVGIYQLLYRSLEFTGGLDPFGEVHNFHDLFFPVAVCEYAYLRPQQVCRVVPVYHAQLVGVEQQKCTNGEYADGIDE
jgi:hypothetical protein